MNKKSLCQSLVRQVSILNVSVLLTVLVGLGFTGVETYGQTQQYFFEDFETSMALPGILPSGWSTTSTDNGSGPSFAIWNQSLANSVGYWPVTEPREGTQFAGLRNANAQCNCAADTSYLQTPSIGLQNIPHPAITFNVFNPDFENFDDAFIQISTDNGATWESIFYAVNQGLFTVMPTHKDDWKSVILDLGFYANNTIQIRFYWSNKGTTAFNSPIDYLGSGYAVDNVRIIDRDAINLTSERTYVGSATDPYMSAPSLPYTMIPLNQVYPVTSNSMVFNTGRSTVFNAGVFSEIFKENVFQGTWTSAIFDSIRPLYKPDISITSEYVPDAMGTYQIKNTVFTGNELYLDDNTTSTRFAVTECTYANDYGDAYGSYQLDSNEYGGNAFFINQADNFNSIQVAIHSGTPLGAEIYGQVYEYIGIDASTGNFIFDLVPGSATIVHTLTAGELSTTSTTKFICLGFPNGLFLEGGKTYFFGVHCNQNFYISFSGGNDVENSLIYSNKNLSYVSKLKTMMVRVVGSCSEPCLIENTNGCINPDACNYNSLAIIDDGSCVLIGATCDDGNNCTINDITSSDCSCQGEQNCSPTINPPYFGCNDGFYNLAFSVQIPSGNTQNTLIVETSYGNTIQVNPPLSNNEYINAGLYPADGSPVWISAYFAESPGIIDTLNTNAPGCCIGYDYEYAYNLYYPGILSFQQFYYCLNDQASPFEFFVFSQLPLTYQWYEVNNLGVSALIPSATQNSYTPPTSSLGTKSYYCVASYGENCSKISNNFIVNVIDGSDFTGTVEDLTICPGYSANLFPNVSITSGNITWYNYEGYVTNHGIALQVQPQSNQSYPFTYSLGSCIAYSDTIHVQVLPTPTVEVTPTVSCSNEPVVLTATSSIANGSFSWSTGETGPSITVNANETTTYTVTFETSECPLNNEDCYNVEFDTYCGSLYEWWYNCPTCFSVYYWEVCTCDNQPAFSNGCNGFTTFYNGSCNDYRVTSSATATIYPNALSSCNDGDECTLNDIIQADCTCSGTLIDENNNGICDFSESCEITATLNPVCAGESTVLSTGIETNYENRVAQFTNSLSQKVVVPYTYSETSIIDNFTYDFWFNTERTITMLPERTGGVNVQAVWGQNFAVFPGFILNPNLRGTGVSVGTNGLCIVEHSGNFFASRFSYERTLVGWHHIAISYINNGFNVYLDGQFIGYRPNGTNFFNNHNRVAPILALGVGYPGNYPLTNSNYDPNDNYSGLMDNFRIWNSTLSGTQINAIYDKTLESSTFAGNYLNITFDDANSSNQTISNPLITTTENNGPSGYPLMTTPVFQYIEGNSLSNYTTSTYQSQYDILWSTGENTPSISVSPQTTTTYNVSITQNGQTCIDEITIDVIPGETFYLDADGDGYGDPNFSVQSCTGAPDGFVVDNTDCHDNDSSIFPGATCDDNNPLTITETYNSDCVCVENNCSSPEGTIANGLIGYWPFCGNANDESGNNNNGTVSGPVLTSDRFGQVNSAYDFDGIDDAITIPAIPSMLPSNISINCWLNAPETGGGHVIRSRFFGYIILFDGTTNTVSFQLHHDVPQSSWTYNSFTSVEWAANEWHMITGTFDGVMNRLYLDGILVSELPSATPFIIYSSDGVVVFGRDGNTAGVPGASHYEGTLDDVGIWNRALTSTEIETLFSGQPPYVTYYQDSDQDGFGNPAVFLQSNTGTPSGYVLDNSDCNDSNANVYPGASCNDLNSQTINDVYNAACECTGTPTGGGCTDPLASNFDPNATVDDGSCTYSECGNYQVIFTTRPCVYDPNIGEVAPAFYVRYFYNGPCTVDFVVVIDENGVESPFPTTSASDSNGGIFGFVYLLPQTTYGVYLIMSDGSISPTFNYTTGTCGGTICDCDGNVHTESVTLWLGDNFADNGAYTLNGQTVDFNCATWGYDCGDITGAPTNVDPYGVCEGNLPPNNGCTNNDLVIIVNDTTIECSEYALNQPLPYITAGGCSNVQVNFVDVIIQENPCETLVNRTWIATDDCGNQATAVTLITILDTTPPQFIGLPTEIFEYCGVVPLPFPILGEDNCDNNPSFQTYLVDYSGSFECPSNYIEYYAYELTDQCGNTTTEIVAVNHMDVEPPVFSSSNQTDFYFNYGDPIELPTPIATDICSDNVSVVMGVTPQELWEPCNTYSQQWIATDECGNTAFFTQNIQIGIDPNASPISCDDDNLCTINDVINADCDCQGTFIDSDGDGICDYYDTPLSIIVTSDTTLECGTFETIDIPTLIIGGCTGSYELTYQDISLTYFSPCEYTVYRNWTVTDSCGNTASALTTIQVLDTTPPVFINLPDDIILECDEYLNWNYTPQAYDNCSLTEFVDVYLSVDTIAGDCPNSYLLYYSISASDACGNTSSANVFIYFIDSEAPVFSSSNQTDFYFNAGEPIELPTPVATDNCSDNVIVEIGFNPLELWEPCNTYSQQWIATDECGNTSFFTQYIHLGIDPNGAPIPCDDNNPCTINDVINADCICEGTSTGANCNFIEIETTFCEAYFFTLLGSVHVANPPSSGSLTITSSCGGSVVLNAPFDNVMDFEISVATNGVANCTLTAVFSAPGAPALSPVNFTQLACCIIPELITDLPPAVTACQNNNNTPLTVGVSGTDYFISWYVSELPNGPFSLIAGANSTTYYPPTDIAFTMYYRCIVTVSALACEVGDAYGGPYISTTCAYTVTPGSTSPTFSTFGPYCAGSSIPALPTTSTNGVQGNWSPAINNLATTTYTFTPNNGQCASSVTRTITITPLTTPSFGTFGPYCAGSNIPALPTTSTNGVQGTWNPAINTQATTTYTFTPSAGQCASSVTRTITITPLTTPSFGTFGAYCAGSNIPALPTTSTNGVQGSWTPAINNLATTTYTFTPNSGQCASSVTRTITITPVTTPSFGTFGPYCAGTNITALPTTSTNGVQGSWNPAINNQTTTTYTFTPNNGQCASSVTATIVITPATTPSFGTFGPYCAGSNIPALPTTSTNGVQGSWNPAINNQTTTTYTFTPNSGQCASSVTAIIVVTQPTTPSFGPFNSYCAGSTIPALPTTSLNGIQGSWSPAINNQTTTTYTFTPNSGQCASSVTAIIVVTQPTTPSFGPFNSYCAGSTIPALPTTSLNGIQGAWSPAINNQTTTTYTFTPNSGQCASSATAVISITPSTTPTFGSFNSYCAGSTIPALPTTSLNGIQGAWSPAINNQTTTTYTFTPNSGQCASSVTTTINITTPVVPSFNTPSPYCQSSAFPALPTTSNNGISGTWAPTVNNQTTATYTFTPDASACATTVDVMISILPSITPTFSLVGNYCEGANIPVLPATSDNGITGSWSPAINNQITTAYVFTPSAGQCAVTTTQTIAIGAAVNAQISAIGNNTLLSCNNPQITLVASGGSSYSWSGGLGNASIAIVTAPGSYTVTASSSAGCQDTLTIIITEAIVNTPFAGNDGQDSLCSNDAATDLFSYLGGAAQTGGVWSGPSGTIPGGIYNPTLHVPGIYQYVVNDATGCASDTAQVEVSETTFIQPDVQYDSPFCASENEVQLPSSLTPSNGSFSISPSTGLNISPTGAINPSQSTIGTYSVTFSIGGACEASDVALVIIEEIPNAVIQASALVVCPSETVTLSANGGVTYLWSNGSTDASIIVNESEVGAYYVEATNDGGCNDVSDTINLSLGTLPTPTITAFGSLSICPGDSVTLAASGGSDWLWNTGQTTQTIEADAAGDYWVIVTNASGCSDTSSSVVIDNINAAGTTISPASNITICAGDQITLTAQPAGQDYLWSTGEISQSIAVDTTGVYSVSTINGAGCSGAASVSVESINRPPALSIPEITICGDETASLCAAPADAYEWTSSTNANFESNAACITVSEGGTYTVTMTNGGLCSSTGSVIVEAISFITCYQDLDGDGFGNNNITLQSCACPPGYSTQSGDCNDNDLGMSPALEETCGDNIDNDCDGLTDGFCDVLGCNDPNACPGSYNPDANLNDGSCEYPGCTYPSATNYDPSAGCDDGSCTFAPPVPGCMDVTACNYTMAATTDDGSCNYSGCNDPTACNFNETAGCDDGSCDYLTLYEIEGDLFYQTPEAFCETSYWYPATPGSTYTWNAAGGTVDAQLQGTDSIVVFWADQGLGSVSVYETTESGCIGAAVTLSVTIQPNPDNGCPTRVGEQTILQLSAYPNPTTGNFTLQIEEQVRGAELMVYDALGKLILQKPIQQLQTTIESDNWAAGVYTLLIRTNEHAASLRVIKE